MTIEEIRSMSQRKLRQEISHNCKVLKDSEGDFWAHIVIDDIDIISPSFYKTKGGAVSGLVTAIKKRLIPSRPRSAASQRGD